MSAISARDEKALNEFYQRHSPLVLALCSKMVGNRADAEQVLLDAFWEFWQRAENYDSQRASPRSYLLLIARSRALDFIRARGARIESAAGTAVAGNDGSLDARSKPSTAAGRDREAGPLQRSIDIEQASIVREALATLEPDQRTAIESAFYEGLTYVEVATRLGLPLGTLKTRMRKALATLRQRLRKHYDEIAIQRDTGDREMGEQEMDGSPRIQRTDQRLTEQDSTAPQPTLVDDDV